MSVIEIEDLWKEYRLGVISHGTLTHDLQSWWARVSGKEDPNSKIAPMLTGQEKQVEGNQFWALRGINLEIKQGEVLGIIGKNGAGKSTLLKILSRVTAPTRGFIKVKGRIASLLEVGTGFHPELTGRENIFMNGAILGMSKQEIRAKLDEIIDFSGVEQFIDTPVKRYSSGMYVRLAFAVAAHLEPEILVVDEVLAVGDAEFQKKCLGKMKEVSTQGRTVLFVSHNLGSISKLCSRVVLLNNGCVAKTGSANQVIEKYMFGDNDRETQKEWHESESPGDDTVLLRSVSIEKINGDNNTEIFTDESFSVKIKVNVKKEPVFLEIGLVVSNFQHGNVIHSACAASMDNEVGSGELVYTAEFPKNLLRHGEYFVSLSAAEPNKKFYFKVDNLIFFNIHSRNPKIMHHGLNSWTGALCPEVVKWKRITIDSP